MDSNVANGQTNPEYATAIFQICGIKEDWTNTPDGWVSSVAEVRRELESLVELIKRRVVENVLERIEMSKAAERVKRFLEARDGK